MSRFYVCELYVYGDVFEHIEVYDEQILRFLFELYAGIFQGLNLLVAFSHLHHEGN